MEAVSQQLQSDLCVAVAAEQSPHRPSLPKLDILAVDADEGTEVEWEAEDDVKRKHLNPLQKHGHERDATQCDSNGWIPSKVAQKHLVTRSRLVCTEVPHKGVEPILSATPPLEALRILLCVACQEEISRVEDPFLISTADVSRAHFYADAVRDVYVRLPDEDSKSKGTRRMWKTTTTVVRTLCTCLGEGRLYPRRGVSASLLPESLASLHPGA